MKPLLPRWFSRSSLPEQTRRPLGRRCLKPALALTTSALLAWFLLPWCFPLPTTLLEAPPRSPLLVDRHGQTLAELPLPDATRSHPVALEALPHDLIRCTLAAEDRRFFTHSGVDGIAMLRAGCDAIQHRRWVSGASTITQQLVKISSPPAPRTLTTKLRELLVARRLEMSWSKQEILTAYLNRINYGNRRVGIAAAARFYFQKPLGDLSLAECALLSALPQAPSRLNPLRYPERAISRRNRILTLLRRDVPSPPLAQRVQLALAEPLALRPLPEPAAILPWLTQQTTTSTASTVPTSIDRALQLDVNQIVQEETDLLASANLRHAAAVVIHNPSREVLALVTSADWRDPRGGQLNGAWLPRSPGSTLKPWLYLLAMDRLQLLPGSILLDIPTPYRTPQGLLLPENYDRRYRGPIPLREALACSLNVPAIRTLAALGGPEPLAELLVNLDFDTLGNHPAEYGLGLAIGNAPARLLTLTNSYATLAMLGEHRPPTWQDNRQHAHAMPSTPRKLPIPASLFRMIADVLSDPAARAEAFPPGGPLDLPFRCAVKTGTSSDFRDNWCLGYTPEFTVGVWAGNFENQPMKGISGIAGAAPIFHRIMLRLHQQHPPRWYPDQPGWQRTLIDRRTGHRLADSATATPHTRWDWFPADRLPHPASPADYAPDGRALLPASCTAWFSKSEHHRQREFALPTIPDTSSTAVKIFSPQDGEVFLLDPEIPSGSHRLIPQTDPPHALTWSCESLRIEAQQDETIIHLTPGHHTLIASRAKDGFTVKLTILVRSMAANSDR